MTTKKDYVAVAAVIQEASPADGMGQQWSSGCDSAREYIARHLSDYFTADNPRFDRQRFLQACGFGGSK